MNLLLLTLPICSGSGNYYLGGTAGGLNSRRMIVVNKAREPYGCSNRRSSRGYGNRNYYGSDECYCSDGGDDSDDVRGCKFCKKRNFNPIIDPTDPGNEGPGTGPGGPDTGPGEGDCCLQNEIDIDDL